VGACGSSSIALPQQLWQPRDVDRDPPGLVLRHHPYVPNNVGKQPTYRIADLTNPLLKPWAVG
jgi:hypothetical protein